MTTTSTFQGMDLDKPSSKVLAPPGGASNICFGGDPAPQQPRQQKAPAAPQAAPQAAPKQDFSPAQSAKPQSSSGFNLLSGEPIQSSPGGTRGKQGPKARMDPAAMPAAGSRVEDRQVTRKMPPGGESSFSFGN